MLGNIPAAYSPPKSGQAKSVRLGLPDETLGISTHPKHGHDCRWGLAAPSIKARMGHIPLWTFAMWPWSLRQAGPDVLLEWGQNAKAQDSGTASACPLLRQNLPGDVWAERGKSP